MSKYRNESRTIPISGLAYREGEVGEAWSAFYSKRRFSFLCFVLTIPTNLVSRMIVVMHFRWDAVLYERAPLRKPEQKCRARKEGKRLQPLEQRLKNKMS